MKPGGIGANGWSRRWCLGWCIRWPCSSAASADPVPGITAAPCTPLLAIASCILNISSGAASLAPSLPANSSASLNKSIPAALSVNTLEKLCAFAGTRGALPDNRSGERALMHLIGTIHDMQCAAMRPHGGQRKIVAEASRAKHLNGAIDHVGKNLGRHDLYHGDLVLRRFFIERVNHPGGFQCQQARLLNFQV